MSPSLTIDLAKSCTCSALQSVSSSLVITCVVCLVHFCHGTPNAHAECVLDKLGDLRIQYWHRHALDKLTVHVLFPIPALLLALSSLVLWLPDLV